MTIEHRARKPNFGTDSFLIVGQRHLVCEGQAHASDLFGDSGLKLFGFLKYMSL